MLNSVPGLLEAAPETLLNVLPFATEAAWRAERLGDVEKLLSTELGNRSEDFNVGVGKALLSMRIDEHEEFRNTVNQLRRSIMSSFSPSTTASMANAHGHLVRLHALYELESIHSLTFNHDAIQKTLKSLDGRLEILGSFTDDKQYILGIRRAAMFNVRFVHHTHINM